MLCPFSLLSILTLASRVGRGGLNRRVGGEGEGGLRGLIETGGLIELLR